MAMYEAFYGRQCRNPVGWFELGRARLLDTDLVQDVLEKVKLILDQLRISQSRQKSYTDRKVHDVAFMAGEQVLLPVSPIKGVMRFGKKGKLSPRYIRPFKILEMIGEVAYKLALPPSIVVVHPVFHVSMLQKYHNDPPHVLDLSSVQLDKDLSYVEESVAILDRQVRKLSSKNIDSVKLSYEEALIAILDRQVRRLRIKDVASVKVLWRNKNVEEMTWEAEEYMKSRYPHLFPLLEEDRTETSQHLGTYIVIGRVKPLVLLMIVALCGFMLLGFLSERRYPDKKI
ncbi:uncharacterized protein [Nicotiana tomentosiformis]|uniref:uncharacterized protein n=1 Tax=Nicotiana tomentosiformis TaxID=4098 RepID=UPI00388C4A61